MYHLPVVWKCSRPLFDGKELLDTLNLPPCPVGVLIGLPDAFLS